ncbi:MAG: ABC transporter substrate binding protein, partial [Pseudolabrys sp.]
VEIGLVPSLNQPGGNLTGMGVFNASLGTKRLELMKELMPNVAVIGYLLNPADGKGELWHKIIVNKDREVRCCRGAVGRNRDKRRLR